MLPPVRYFCFSSLRRMMAIGAACAVLLASFPAMADDPFDMEPSSWVSFDRYKEKPANWVPPEIRAQAKIDPVIVAPPTLPPNMPLVSAPARPINTPALPGVNGSEEQAGLESDDKDSSTTIDAKNSDFSIPQTSWRDAVQFAHNKKSATRNDDDTDGGPLDVRFTYLPGMIAPVAKAKKPALESVVKKVEVAQSKPVTPAAPNPPPAPVTVAAPPAADPAVCAAIDAYKKRQLAAIESDRHTLEALKAAIAELGLQKKLDFMTNENNSIKLQEAGSSNMDMPVKN